MEDGIFEILDTTPDTIYIEDGVWVILIDWSTKKSSRNIIQKAGSKLQIFWVIEKNFEHNIEVKVEWKGTESNINYFFFSKEQDKLNASVFSNIQASDNKTDIQIVSIAWDGWEIDLNWGIKIWKWLQKVEWKISEENIFLWTMGKIRWIPSLLVESNDVKASHSAKTHRVEEQVIHYLRSRWIPKEEAKIMLIEWIIRKLFSTLQSCDTVNYMKLVDKSLKYIS